MLTWLFVDHFRDYDSWPWSHFNSVQNQVIEHPSFVVCEMLFTTLVLVSLYHACSTQDPDNTRQLKLTWVTTFIVGTVNDYIFMILPVVDNFWQAQAIVMLTPRMPLYIPLVYNAFMYWSLVAAARVFYRKQNSRLAEACLCGLLGGIFYAPYDVCGARFLWWTWHNSDPAIILRWMGAPAGSTAWTITFNFSLCYLLRVGSDKGWGPFRKLALACLSTPMMIVVLNCVMLVALDKVAVPGVRTIIAATLVFSCVVFHRLFLSSTEPIRASKPVAKPRRGERNFVIFSMGAYFTTLICIMAIFSPENQVATGAHQVFGPCNTTDFDLLGYPRQRYICANNYPDWYFKFDCPKAVAGAVGRWAHVKPQNSGDATISWYTVCGQPHESWPLWMATVVGLCSLGFAAFTWSLSIPFKQDDVASECNKNE